MIAEFSNNYDTIDYSRSLRMESACLKYCIIGMKRYDSACGRAQTHSGEDRPNQGYEVGTACGRAGPQGLVSGVCSLEPAACENFGMKNL
jgi:hypothetical protein